MKKIKTKEELESLIKSGIVLVKIGQEFCGPCRLVESNLSAIESDYSGKVEFAKIDANDCDEELLDGIMSIPVTRLYVNGEIKSQEVGLRTKEQLKTLLDEATN